MSIKGCARLFGVSVLALMLVMLAILASALWLERLGVTPLALAHHLAGPAGATPRTAALRSRLAAALLRLGRAAPPAWSGVPAGIGAQAQGAASGPQAGALRTVLVASSAQVRAAIASAEPGDVIVLAPGVYRFSGAAIDVARAGTRAAPILLRGAAPGLARLEFDLVEGFVVSAPYWTFADLAIRGVCAAHAQCEHAFHVVGAAHHFAALNNVIVDFNAHLKINGSGGHFPDHGRIDGNSLSNLSARKTANPVTLIDLVAASDWIIRRNLISDFIKRDGDAISYGAYAKGGGARNLFERNVVWCERLLRGHAGQRIGLSLGGGATAAQYCRDGRCITEQEDSVIESNLIIGCSSDGIYLNSAARSRIVQNSLVDTDGIELRFPTSSADLSGNLVDGAIRRRQGAIARLDDNLESRIARAYLGLQAAPAAASLEGRAPRRPAPAAAPPDLCGRQRPTTPTYGAWETLTACPWP